MNGTFFSKSFLFRNIFRGQYHYNDSRSGSAYHYVAYMKRGSCKIVSKYCTIEVKAGDVFYIPSELPYQSYWYGEPDTVFTSLGFRFFPESANKKFCLQNIDCPDEIKKQIQDIPTPNLPDCNTLGLFYTMLDKLMPYMSTDEVTNDERIVSDSIEYMYSNPSCLAKDLSRHANISESALYSAFKKVKGQTPNAIKQQILSEKAVLLLTTTNESVEDISEELGFSSTSYFRKILHRTLGKTPRQIRKEASII